MCLLEINSRFIRVFSHVVLWVLDKPLYNGLEAFIWFVGAVARKLIFSGRRKSGTTRTVSDYTCSLVWTFWVDIAASTWHLGTNPIITILGRCIRFGGFNNNAITLAWLKLVIFTKRIFFDLPMAICSELVVYGWIGTKSVEITLSIWPSIEKINPASVEALIKRRRYLLPFSNVLVK